MQLTLIIQNSYISCVRTVILNPSPETQNQKEY